MPPVVPPRRRGSGFEAIHGALVLALLVHALGLAACWLRTAEPQDRALRVVAPVELVDSLPPPPPKPAPIRVPAPPPPPLAVVEPVALPAVVAGVPVSSGTAAAGPPVVPRLPTASQALGTAPPALPGPAAPSARSGPSGTRSRRASPRVAPVEASPLPSASSAREGRPAAPSPSPAAGGAGSHRWAWVPGPEQPRPVSQGTAPPGEALGRARAWVELRIPANDGRPLAPSEVRVLEVELLDETPLPKAEREARLRARADAVARSSRWKPGTRDGRPADHTVQLFLEFDGR